MNTLNKASPKYICDGEIEIVKLTKEYQEDAVKLFMENFPKNENFSIATNLPANPNAIREIEILFREVLRDGISFGAKHIKNGTLAAICANKLLAPKSNLSLDDIFLTFTTPEMIFIGNCLEEMENSFDIYKELNIDCSVEVVFLSTRPEFERKGIASALTQYSIEFFKDFGNGLFSDEDFPEHIQGKRPKAVCSIFSTKFTQIIGKKLGFETVVTRPYTDIEYNGYKFSDKLDPIHNCTTFAIKRL
ncbi:uncharacterized protein LOC129942185 [Eupeodes corollae]|uniref:uncharacterized protein LOC129942185 n=1 Tax=Eupeodes corollae TaxID=290404 RepID=UPI0024932BA7|nr:uncharacterized protein LOC129942185 [Eupeodes corollae]